MDLSISKTTKSLQPPLTIDLCHGHIVVRGFQIGTPSPCLVRKRKTRLQSAPATIRIPRRTYQDQEAFTKSWITGASPRRSASTSDLPDADFSGYFKLVPLSRRVATIPHGSSRNSLISQGFSKHRMTQNDSARERIVAAQHAEHAIESDSDASECTKGYTTVRKPGQRIRNWPEIVINADRSNDRVKIFHQAVASGNFDNENSFEESLGITGGFHMTANIKLSDLKVHANGQFVRVKSSGEDPVKILSKLLRTQPISRSRMVSSINRLIAKLRMKVRYKSVRGIVHG